MKMVVEMINPHRLSYNKENDVIWKDEKELKSVISNLHEAFWDCPQVIWLGLGEEWPAADDRNYGSIQEL